MTGQTTDEMIYSLELELDLLRYEKKKLNKKMIENRQQTAAVRNRLRQLKEEKKVSA